MEFTEEAHNCSVTKKKKEQEKGQLRGEGSQKNSFKV